MQAVPVPARALVHQEGVICLVAIVGLSLRDSGPLPFLEAHSGVLVGLLAGCAVGLVLGGSFFLLCRLPMVAELAAWQRELVRGWSVADAAAVAFISGLAEEALLRALLQPLIGLVPAALVFALLHLIPDRRLWVWPLLALLAGLLFGLLFDHYGYPAAAVAHMTLNGLSLYVLSQGEG